MMFDLILESGRLWAKGPPRSVALHRGQIAAIDPPEQACGGSPRLSAAGGIVFPGLINIHTHLDKAFLADRILNSSGTLAEVRLRMKEAKARFTRDDVMARATLAIRQSIRRGVTAIRTHVDIDPGVGLRSLEALLELKQRFRSIVDLQIVAFPQEGIISPGTEALMREALRMGADVVGGHLSIAHDLESLRAETDLVFDLAQSFDRDIDVHVDIDIDRDYACTVSLHSDGRRYPDGLGIVYLAEKTIAEGYQGRVAASHVCGLDAVSPDLRAAVIELIRLADVAVVALPASNLYTHGRGDEVGTRRGVTRLRELRTMGVRVAVGTDNIRDPFLPFGNADLIQNAVISALACHLVTPEDFLVMLHMHATEPAGIMRVQGYGLEPGCRADLVVFNARGLDELLDGETLPRWVVKQGRVVVETEFIVRYLKEEDASA